MKRQRTAETIKELQDNIEFFFCLKFSESTPAAVFCFTSSLHFYCLLHIKGGKGYYSPYALRETRETIETNFAPELLLYCKVACENCRLPDGATTCGSESRRLARLCFCWNEGPASSLARETKNRGQVPHVKSFRLPSMADSFSLSTVLCTSNGT